MRRASAAARLIASMIEFSEIGAETIYIISAPDRAGAGEWGPTLLCVWGFAFRDRSPPIRHIWDQFTSQSQSPFSSSSSSSLASVGLNDLSSCCWRSS